MGPLPCPRRLAPAVSGRLEGKIPPEKTRSLSSRCVTPDISLAALVQRAGTQRPFSRGKIINQMEALHFLFSF